MTGKNINPQMNNLTHQYDVLIMGAEVQHRDCGNKPSKQEAALYREAVKVCEEIRDLNLTNSAMYNKWDERAKKCNESVEEIVRSLTPTSPPPKVISAEEIEKWYIPRPSYGLDNVFGREMLKSYWKRYVKHLDMRELNNILGVNSVDAFLCYGLSGVGKSYFIGAVINELMNKGYKCIRLSGSDIRNRMVSESERIIEAAFQEAINHSPCIIFVSDLEEICINRALANVDSYPKRLTVAFLKAYAELRQSRHQVILFAETNAPQLVDPAFVDQSRPILFPLPDKQTRAGYLESRLREILLEDDLTIEYMSEILDGCIYYDLNEIVDLIKRQIIEKAFEKYTVYAEENKIDFAQTHAAVASALKNEELKLSKEQFDSIFASFTFSDRSEALKSIEKFNARLAGD